MNNSLAMSFTLNPFVSFNALKTSAIYPNPTVYMGGLSKNTAISPPINNMGETVDGLQNALRHRADEIDAIASKSEMIIMVGGKPKALPVRLPAGGQVAVLDWLNVTCGLESFDPDYSRKFLEAKQTDSEEFLIHDMVHDISVHLVQLFGSKFRVGKRNNSGRNFYKYSYPIGDCDNPYGLVCIGGQRHTVLIMLNGTGCALAKDGWEYRVYKFLNDEKTKRPRITRVDLAHDDFDGAHSSAEWADQMDKLGGFQCGNRAPNVQHLGNWRRPTGKGRTLTIGQRESGKYFRGYERGRKEGDPDSPWFRSEVEFKSSDRHLPFEILLNPSSYFVAAYPCLRDFDLYQSPERIETTKKSAKVSWDASIQNVKRQFGKYLTVFRGVYDDSELLDLIQSTDKNAKPRRLALACDLAERQTMSESIRASFAA